ncbi:transcription termination factor NusA [Candidatus Latescibacterota bacterium]
MSNLNIVEALSQIAREKNVDRDMVVQTLADALVSAAKKRYGNTDNFEVELDATTGHMAVMARKTVVEEVNEPGLEIELEDARQIDKQAQLGAVVFEELNLADFGRNAIQTAKQILIQRVREAERERIYEQYGGRASQVESGTVQQISHGDIVLNLGRAEAAIPLKEQIRRERYRQGDTVRGYIFQVLKSSRGPQVLLSRTHPEFLRKLFAIEVPEIAEGIVQIHAVAREPGERAKIAVSSNDERVDPVGACVGVKGSRVQAIVRELSGERIDIVPWIDEPEIFVSRALSPASVSRVILDHRRHYASVIVEEEQLSLAIGKAGQNSRLAVQLTGWGLDIIAEDEYQKRRARVEESQEELRRLPSVSELIALSLATSGYMSIRAISEADVESLQSVPGLEGQPGRSLREEARTYVSEAEARGETLRSSDFGHGPIEEDEESGEETTAGEVEASAEEPMPASADEAPNAATDAAEAAAEEAQESPPPGEEGTAPEEAAVEAPAVEAPADEGPVDGVSADGASDAETSATETEPDTESDSPAGVLEAAEDQGDAQTQ